MYAWEIFCGNKNILLLNKMPKKANNWRDLI